MRAPLVAIALLALAPFAVVARADTPLPPPAVKVSTSSGGTVRAVSDPRTNTTRIEVIATGKLLWTLPGWHRWVRVSDDGRHAVTEYGNLIPVDHDAGMVLITLWREGKKVREVTLKELVPAPAVLKRTASHYHWGDVEQIDAQGRLAVRRADGQLFRFDMETGSRVR